LFVDVCQEILSPDEYTQLVAVDRGSQFAMPENQPKMSDFVSRKVTANNCMQI